MSYSEENIIEFTILYNRYKTKVYNYVLKMVKDKMTSEDIVQVVFTKLFVNAAAIRNKENIYAWLFTTARNEIFTYYRNKKIRVDQFNVEDTDDIEVDSGTNIADFFEIKETKEIIMNELNNLPPEQSEVFILKEYGGLSYYEIASVMKIDENLVRSRLFKTRQKLINKLSKIIK